MSLSFNLLQSNGYFRKWEITFDGYFAFGGITSFGDLEKTNTAAKVAKPIRRQQSLNTHPIFSFANDLADNHIYFQFAYLSKMSFMKDILYFKKNVFLLSEKLVKLP